MYRGTFGVPRTNRNLARHPLSEENRQNRLSFSSEVRNDTANDSQTLKDRVIRSVLFESIQSVTCRLPRQLQSTARKGLLMAAKKSGSITVVSLILGLSIILVLISTILVTKTRSRRIETSHRVRVQPTTSKPETRASLFSHITT